MPTIKLTNNTGLDVTASSADGFATLNRYLTQPLTFATPAALGAIAGTTVASLDPKAFPITAGATAAGKFAVGGTSLGVQMGPSASVGLLIGDHAEDFFTSLGWTVDSALPNLVSFGLTAKLGVGDSGAVGDFSLGITTGATVALTSFCTAAGDEKFADAVQRAIAALTIPHDLADLRSLPANTACRMAASGCLRFAASVTYSILNNPLATAAIPNLPAIAVNAQAGATLDATATHSSDHTVTIVKLANGRIHLSVNLNRTDDLEASLSVSAGMTAKVGDQDALAFLLDRISPNSKEEWKKIQQDMPHEKAEQLSGDIKAAIDSALCSSLQASLKAALEDSESRSRVILCEIDLDALDGGATAALQSALKGDFTTITNPKVHLAGISVLDSVLTRTSTIKHSLTLHLLGIFNWGDTNTFIEKSKVSYTKGTHQIVLSDETVEIETNNLAGEKLREVLVKGITLTIPASANTPEAAMPITTVFFDRQGSTSRSTMHQFVNVLNVTRSSSAADAKTLLDRNSEPYGTSSLYLGLTLNPVQCKQLFIDAAGKARDWNSYRTFACEAAATILYRDEDNADRYKLFTMGEKFWTDLRDAGARDNVLALLTAHGIRQNATVDVTTVIWWASAMAGYAKALANGSSLVEAGREVVRDATRGFAEPWMVLATWNILEGPSMESVFTSSLPKPGK